MQAPYVYVPHDSNTQAYSPFMAVNDLNSFEQVKLHN